MIPLSRPLPSPSSSPPSPPPAGRPPCAAYTGRITLLAVLCSIAAYAAINGPSLESLALAAAPTEQDRLQIQTWQLIHLGGPPGGGGGGGDDDDDNGDGYGDSANFWPSQKKALAQVAAQGSATSAAIGEQHPEGSVAVDEDVSLTVVPNNSVDGLDIKTTAATEPTATRAVSAPPPPQPPPPPPPATPLPPSPDSPPPPSQPAAAAAGGGDGGGDDQLPRGGTPPPTDDAAPATCSRADERSGLKGGCSARRLISFDDDQPPVAEAADPKPEHTPSDEPGECSWCYAGDDGGAMQECAKCGAFFHIDDPCATNMLGYTVAPSGAFGDITCRECASGSVSGSTATETNDDDDSAATSQVLARAAEPHPKDPTKRQTQPSNLGS